MARSYSTILGDTWDTVSFRMYGNEHRVKELIDANILYIDTAIFAAGVTLVIPDIPVPTARNLPPWKR